MIGSLFSGVGALDRAVEAILGEQLAWSVDIDPACRLVLERHWPAAQHLDHLDKPRERTEYLVAGFPCQPFSLAGLRRGGDDDRDGRPLVLAAVERDQPRVVFLENVPGFAPKSKPGPRAGLVPNLLELGYSVADVTLGACAVEAAHHRHRWYAIAWQSGSPAERRFQVPCGAPQRRNALPPTPVARDGHSRNDVNALIRRRAEGWTKGLTLGPALQMLALLPSPGALAMRTSSSAVELETALHSLLPTPRATDGSNGGPNQRGRRGDLALPSAVQPANWGQYAAAVARHEAMYGDLPDPLEVGPRGGLRLRWPFVQSLMALPDDWIAPDCDRLDALRMLGNAVFAPAAEAAYRHLITWAQIPITPTEKEAS